jgi:hypothetical protein
MRGLSGKMRSTSIRRGTGRLRGTAAADADCSVVIKSYPPFYNKVINKKPYLFSL